MYNNIFFIVLIHILVFIGDSNGFDDFNEEFLSYHVYHRQSNLSKISRIKIRDVEGSGKLIR